MVLQSPVAPFLWGAGGTAKTPDQVARDRQLAAALLGGSIDTSPVESWTQGLARVADAAVGAYGNWRANEAETAGRQGFQQRWDDVFGGGQTASANPVAAVLSPHHTATDAVNGLASVPSGETAGYIRQGLINRGLPDHVADAFLMNFQDESGLNPGVNEAEPLVPGSRGGYGLYQLTGPRRTAYEAYAAQQGVDPSNIDAQLDFMMSELAGPEANAYQAIMAAPDAGSAAAAIVNDFLRPAEEHRARRAAAYAGGATPIQVAQGPDMAALLGLASDPWADDTQRSIAMSLFGSQMQQQDPRYQQQLALGDLQMQQAQMELEALRNPQPDPGFRVLTPQEAAAMNLPDGAYQVGPDNKVYEIGGGGVNVNLPGQPTIGTIPAGYAATQGADGAWTMAPVPGSPAAAEAEAASAAASASAAQTGTTANIVREDIGRIRDIVTNAPWFNPAVGFGSGLLQQLEGTNATNVAALSETVRANIGFDRLQAMREASPTGGALGNVTERELSNLQAVMGNLGQSQSVEQFLYNLDRLGEVYDGIISKAAAYPNAAQFGFGGVSPSSDAAPLGIDALLEKYQ